MSERYGLVHISTGDILRLAVQEGSALGRRVQSILDEGALVPDDLMIELIRERIDRPDCEKGYVLDGFPRTLGQAEALETIYEDLGEDVPRVLLFDVNSDVLAQRLTSRRGREARSDDAEAVQLERLRVYQRDTAPLVSYYEERGLLDRVDGCGNIEEVSARIARVVHS